jgi:hypothetical protein
MEIGPPPIPDALADLMFGPTTEAANANPPIARPDPFINDLLSTTPCVALPIKDEFWEPIAIPCVFFLSIFYLLKVNLV